MVVATEQVQTVLILCCRWYVDVRVFLAAVKIRTFVRTIFNLDGQDGPEEKRVLEMDGCVTLACGKQP